MVYAASLFDSSTAARIAQHLCILLTAATARPDTPLAKLSLIDTAERQLVLHTFNDTDTSYPASKTVHQLFEKHAARRPDTTCLVYGAARLSYGAVNVMANQLAHWLVSRGIGSDTVVGVSSHKCPELYVALLAVLKAGGAYVPMDPALPPERATYMMQQTGVQLLLTSASNRLARPSGVQVVVIDQGWKQFVNQPSTNLPQRSGPTDLANITFTSGSTGQPKVLCLSS